MGGDFKLCKGREGLVLLKSGIFAEEGFIAAFTTRKGGWSPPPFDGLNMGFGVPDDPSNVIKNRELVLTELGLDPSKAASMRQIHGVRIQEVEDGAIGGGMLPEGSIPGTDGIFTSRQGVSLIGTFADCVPIVIANPKTRRIGVVHAGWRGTALGACLALADSMGITKENAADCIAAIGPHIKPCCYEVGEEVADQICSMEFCAPAISREAGIIRADLGYANELQLKSFGFTKSHISSYEGCTSCEEGMFFSHRRDKGRTGRSAAIAASLQG